MSNDFAYLASADLTDVGRLRKNNEDSVLRLPEQGVFCVADGMGGAQGGEMASRATVASLNEMFAKSLDAPFAVTAKSSARLVVRALNRASQWIKARAGERGMSGTGSTALVLVFDKVTPSQAMVLHAGDSRAYRFRADKLVQLSADHSIAAAAGLRNEKKLPVMFRGVITRAVGLEDTVLLEETPADVAAGDLFLLCSDGLTKMLSDRQIHKLLWKNRKDDVQALAQKLIDEALKAGGEDNVSVVLVSVGSGLPQGPTQALQERTRLLEQPPVPSVVTAGAGAEAHDDPEAETGDSGQSATGDTGDTENSVRGPSHLEDKEGAQSESHAVCQTPVTPSSGEGVTPAEVAQEQELADTQTGDPTPAPVPVRTPTKHSWVWWADVILLLLYSIAGVIWLLLRVR